MEYRFHGKELVEILGAFEPFIETIEQNQKTDEFNPTLFFLRSSFHRLDDQEELYLKTKYPKIYMFVTSEQVDTMPPHVDYWERAEPGDIIMKTGTHYASSVPNGNHYVVIEVLDDASAIILDIDGELKSLAHPEEYKIIEKLQDKLDAKNKAMREFSQRIDDAIKINEEKGILSFLDKELVQSFIAKGFSKEDILEVVPHCRFTEDGKPILDIK